MKTLLILLCAVLVVGGCSPSGPDAPPPPPSNVVNVTIPGNPNCVIVNGNGCNTIAPSPSPGSGPFVKPDYVKITQFGESCPSTVIAGPSGQDRSVRIGCTKALTLSPKCRQPNGPDIDCPVPENAAPDSFEVKSGGEHILFSAFGSATLSSLGLEVSAFTGVHMKSDAFNRLATGVSEGAAVIVGAYAGIPTQADFVLTVVK